MIHFEIFLRFSFYVSIDCFRFLTPRPFHGKSSTRPRVHFPSTARRFFSQYPARTMKTQGHNRIDETGNEAFRTKVLICTYIRLYMRMYLLLHLSLASRRVTKENDKTFALLVIITIAASIRAARSATMLLINFAISPSRQS